MLETNFYLPFPYNIYCEKIVPDKISQPFPIIMIHGAAHTGSCYKTKPDGFPGWAYFFAKQGYEVYIPDWPGTGRSGYVPFEMINGQFMAESFKELIKKIDRKVIVLVHSMSGPYGWKLGELIGDKISNIIAVAPGEMENIQSAPNIIKKTKDATEVKMPWGALNINLNQYLLNDENFVVKKLIGESQFFPIDYIEEYKASLQPLHPVLTYERLNINESQLKIKNFSKYKNINVLVVNGTHDQDHPKEKKQAIINYFKKHKIKSELCWLGDKGIIGNGHMLMLEKNSNDIADLIHKYIQKNLDK